jgi:hypothetical protein
MDGESIKRRGMLKKATLKWFVVRFEAKKVEIWMNFKLSILREKILSARKFCLLRSYVSSEVLSPQKLHFLLI